MGGITSLLMKFPAGLNLPLAWQCIVSFPRYGFAQDLVVVGTSAVSAQILAARCLCCPGW